MSTANGTILGDEKEHADRWAWLFRRALADPDCRDVEEATVIAGLAMESLPPNAELAIKDDEGNLHSEKSGRFVEQGKEESKVKEKPTPAVARPEDKPTSDLKAEIIKKRREGVEIKAEMSRQHGEEILNKLKRPGWKEVKSATGTYDSPSIEMEGGLFVVSMGQKVAVTEDEQKIAGTFKNKKGQEFESATLTTAKSSLSAYDRGRMRHVGFFKTPAGAMVEAEIRFKVMHDQGKLSGMEMTPAMQETLDRVSEPMKAFIKEGVDPDSILPNGKTTPDGYIKCPKCAGMGALYEYGHVAEGTCFMCNGSGIKKFKNSKKMSVDDDGVIDAHFSYDIFSRKAQGILNRAVTAAKQISASARKDLERSLNTSDPAEMSKSLLTFIQRYKVQLADLLTTTQLAAILEGAREVAKSIPAVPAFAGVATMPATLEPHRAAELLDKVYLLPVGDREALIYELPADQQAFVRQGLIAKQQGVPPLTPFTPQAPISGTPERIHYPIIDEAAKALAKKNVMTRSQFDLLDSAARQKAFTVAHVESLDTIAKIRNAMAESVEQGVDLAAFREKVLAAVDEGTFMSDAHLEVVFRTNVQTAFSDGQMKVLQHPFVRSGFPYASYEAIHDDRVEHTHLEMESLGIQGTNIYRINDPVFQLFRPPWRWSCRCSWIPMTVRMAASKGIAEAQQWLDTGVEPTPPAFVAMPSFRPPPGFERSLSGMPLSIQLSVQPLPDFWGVMPVAMPSLAPQRTEKEIYDEARAKYGGMIFGEKP
jgi:hypothetical protein